MFDSQHDRKPGWQDRDPAGKQRETSHRSCRNLAATAAAAAQQCCKMSGWVVHAARQHVAYWPAHIIQ